MKHPRMEITVPSWFAPVCLLAAIAILCYARLTPTEFPGGHKSAYVLMSFACGWAAKTQIKALRLVAISLFVLSVALWYTERRDGKRYSETLAQEAKAAMESVRRAKLASEHQKPTTALEALRPSTQ